jgi:hypothetical protein
MERINLIFAENSENTDLPGWKEIGAILDSERFVALRHVVLYILRPWKNYGIDDEWLVKLSDQLHSLNYRGILRVHRLDVRPIHSWFGAAHIEMYNPGSLQGYS